MIVSEKELMQHPLLEQDVLKEAVPGTIRKAQHFLSFLRRVLVCLKEKLTNDKRVQILTPLQLLYWLSETYFIEQKSLKFAHDRLTSLLNTLEIVNLEEYRSLGLVADFATLLSTYFKGFTVIIEPYPEDNLIYDPLMQFYCLDASLATRPLFAKYRNVILTSGTISPIEMYPKILDFTPKVMKAFDIVLPRNAI
jgi:DNA excision repair protein ERCC-2